MLLIAGACLASGVRRARAQGVPDPTHGAEVWAALSPGSSRWGVLGATPGVQLALGAVRFSRALGGQAVAAPARRPRWWYGVDVIPLALISPPYVSTPGAPGCRLDVVCAMQPADSRSGLFPRGAVYGAGVNPVGLTTAWHASPRVALTLGANGGVLWTTQPVPTTRAARLNFTGSVELGARLRTGRRSDVALVYRFHHLSNAHTAAENTAVASHLLGVSVGRGGIR